MRSLLEFARTLTPDLGTEGILRSVERTIMGKGLITETFAYFQKDEANTSFRFLNRIGFRTVELPAELSFEHLETWIVRPPDGCAFILPIFDSDQQEIIAFIGFGKSLSSTIDIEDEPNYLESLSLLTGIALTNAKLFIRERERERMEAELRLAREIQQSLLPQTFPEIEGIIFHAYSKQSQHVGGDYYDFLRINDDDALVVIADVVGKGIGAAILMSNMQASIHTLVSGLRNSFFDLNTLVNELNRVIYESTTAERYITAVLAVINARTKICTSYVCGHPHPLVIAKDETIRTLATSGIPLGIFATYDFQEFQTQLVTGDRLVLYTDGISEAYNSNEMLGEEGVARLFIKKHIESKDDLRLLLEKDEEINVSDDITVVVVDVQ